MDSDNENPAELFPSTSPVEPAKVRALVRQEAAMFGVQVGPAPNPFVEKMTDVHITQVIENAEADSKRSDQRVRFLVTVGCVTFLAICGLFLYAKEPALLEKVLSLFIGLVGGFAGGYGYKSLKP
jgi:hypothetical protein